MIKILINEQLQKDAQTYLNKVLREIDQGNFVDLSPIARDINFQTGTMTLQRALLWKRDVTWY
jgi:predicted RNA-binding protein Jag